MVVLETFWPLDSSDLCRSLQYLWSLEVLNLSDHPPHSVWGQGTHTSSFRLILNVFSCFKLLFALIVKTGIFNCWYIFLYLLPDLCSSANFPHIFTMSSGLFHSDQWQKGILLVSNQIYTPVKQDVMVDHFTVPNQTGELKNGNYEWKYTLVRF